jgi:pimeloyl-ACP methyl ester carboxylesterase
VLLSAHDHRPHLPLLSQTNAGTNRRNSLRQSITASPMTDLSLSNGSIRLAASVHGPMNALPILFLHGVTLSRDSWDEIKDRLISRCCVWALDFRGHGHSDRAPNYDLSGYVSDAETALAAIGRPAIVVGHSLGACVAGVLGQSNPNVRAIFLEDPPWFLGRTEDWEQSVFSKLFSFLSLRLPRWQQELAPLATYLEFLSNGRDFLGGQAKDHITSRHLLSHASAIQRLDTRCIGDDVLRSLLSSISTDRPFLCPSKIIRGEQRLGAALWDAHVEPLKVTNPELEIVQYEQSGHHPHRMIALAERFSRDLEDFAMLFNGGAQQLPRTTSSFENDSDTLELGMTLGG